MNTTQKIIGGIILVGLIAIGGYFYPNSKVITQMFGQIAGVTNSQQRIAQCVLDFSTTTPTTATTTSTGCLFNGDSNDRIVTSVEMSFNGLSTITFNGGLATSTMALSTSTAQFATTSSNYLLYSAIATTTALAPNGNAYFASTTPGVTGTGTNTGSYGSPNDFARRWAAGSYLNLVTTGTSTAQGVILVRYFIAN